MPAKRPLTVIGIPVTVRELTLREVRDWLTEVEAGERTDPVHALAFEGFNLADLAKMIDVPVGQLEGAPSDLEELITTCKALNPHFFRVRAALNSVARMVVAEAQARPLTTTPASWWDVATRIFGRIRGART